MFCVSESREGLIRWPIHRCYLKARWEARLSHDGLVPPFYGHMDAALKRCSSFGGIGE